MSIFNRAIGAFDALMSQARSYKLGPVATQAKRIASDVATRSGGWTGIKRYGMVGGGIGAAVGGAYNYYDTGGGPGTGGSILGGAVRGGLLGAGLGMGYRGFGGLRSSMKAGLVGQYAASARASLANRVTLARMDNAFTRASRDLRNMARG